MPFCCSYKSLLSLHQSDLTFEITGTNPDYPTYVAIKGTVFDVSGNKAYGPEGSYKGKSNPVYIHSGHIVSPHHKGIDD
jgi:hypothetical protein